MSNLPDGVKVSDSDAPWNQDHPTPDWQCKECERYGKDEELSGAKITCPDCGGEVTDY